MAVDLLLINPPYFPPREMGRRREHFERWIRGGNMYIHPFEPPLGLAALAAYLKGKGYRVELADMVGLGMEEADLRTRMLETEPRFVGITAMTPTFPQALRIARLTRETLPEKKVILGGVHPTVCPQPCLENSDIDLVVRGEGEKVMETLLSGATAMERDNIPGLCTQIDGRIVVRDCAPMIPDMDALPLPDYDSLPVKRYVRYNKNLRGIRAISLLVSRGCPYSCSFCAVHQTMGKKFRIKSPSRVVDEMEQLKAAYSLEGIWFKDSILNFDRRWMAAFCAEIRRRGLKIAWQCNTRADLVDEDQLQGAKEAGLVQIDIGIESGSPASLRTLNKKLSVAQIRRAVRTAKKYVKISGFFMIGIPGETEDDIDSTVRLAEELELDKSTWSLFAPLPGTALHDELARSEFFADRLEELEKIHFTENPHSFCNVPAPRLRSLYERINESPVRQQPKG